MAEQVEDFGAAGSLLGSWTTKPSWLNGPKPSRRLSATSTTAITASSSITSFAVPWMWRWPKS